ncbi:Protein of unknown function (DUF4232) [Nocardia amikacinitolerans]|uniref:DUF4232 domain-containing protein n=1 Tax=Nocardia amikacinitolerans TaxID=756689 RepID=UPI0009FE6910|nr:DUF4232 domain-containing protein [Nocardia amikacinitolerans]MCP2316443.1 Protein of unknown function (DUF4232) [Nocardia amikacinitolerans]
MGMRACVIGAGIAGVLIGCAGCASPREYGTDDAIWASTTTAKAAGAQSTSGVPDDPLRCRSAELSLRSVAGPRDGGGAVRAYLVLTNASGRTCTVFGHPGVDFVNNDTLFGARTEPVPPSASAPRAVQTLDPGESTAAEFVFRGEPGGTCTEMNAIRVVPPDETVALTTPLVDLHAGPVARFRVCDKVVTVGAFTTARGLPRK